MRMLLCLPSIALLGACSVIPPQAYTFDPTQPQPKLALATSEVTALTQRVAQLQLRRNEIQAQIATEPDARNRQLYYEDLHRLGMELSPLERRLSTIASSR
jgi:hypothetical protein